MRAFGKHRGNSLIEFALAGVPATFLIVSVIDAGIDLWQYYSVAYGAEVTSRYAGMHGAGCSQNGNACGTTIGDLAYMFTRNAPAVSASDLNITFTDSSGSTQRNPAVTCAGNSSPFPASTGGANEAGNDVVIKATFPLTLPIAMFWPGSAPVSGGNFVVGATSRQEIVF